MGIKGGVWKPALNKEKQAVGTFEGLYVQEHENSQGKWESHEALFKILGEDGNEKEIPLRLPFKFAETNALGEFANATGFKYGVEYETNPDGFEIMKSNNIDTLDEHFEQCEGKRYQLQMKLNERFLWVIDPSSLREFAPVK
ncbi:hypothetical protein IQ249_25050 [Lusitaniella coriacea LEGE 07157]|uniref:Uncharacterized protein n=1 Tax=Lusitaniella coriacea LEGE 07157 TaxID=945747 RepID=A0A8J7IYG2_9CYAN|nr:hypothetical protein [Lusitaniella coriacea]MBE9119128.1 hypothetical protein [Lusitaniella coriacea LEGE 07157]